MKLDGKSNEELTKLMAEIEADPKNQAPEGQVYKYTPEARRKLDKIAMAITHNLAEKRAAAGDPVPTCGYSGMKKNRRR